MPSKKITYHPKTRKDLSNPFGQYSHTELLKLVNAHNFDGAFEIKSLKNGRIKVEPVVDRPNKDK